MNNFGRLVWHKVIRHLSRFSSPLSAPLSHQKRCYARILPFIFQKQAQLVQIVAAYAIFRYGILRLTPAFGKEDSNSDLKLPRRLKRFRNFASIEYDKVEYMTPQDFLDSLILDEPKERVFRRVIRKDQLGTIVSKTPPLRNGSSKMFRDLGENGIISYAEYLFLLTLLTKSRSSFDIAFALFDDDENSRIDKEEFLKIRSLIIQSKDLTEDADDDNEKNDQLEKLMSNRNLTKPTLNGDSSSSKDMSEKRTTERSHWSTSTETSKEDAISTTILVHLFGHNGRNSLSFDQFQIFYNNLQKELIEIEFTEFSRGKPEISAVDFARLVLRYSILHKNDQSPYIRRVYERTRSSDHPGITLQQFEQFSMFLNNLEDFSKAVRLYTAADIPVSRAEFARAVKCSTGFELDPHLVDTLFFIFDANGDDKLSYPEFIGIMNDRLHRGFKNYSSRHATFGWHSFRDCVVHELSTF
ncbi:EF-hand domain pair domain-containing protein [Ditylenchus destructor]|nr:EF-hand domain pair domain-containing protein [Ditylenchus destructor]